MRIEERQRLCIELIRRFPKRFILIGGYATTAFEFPRFSVNLDLAVKGRDLKGFKSVLEKEGFKLVQVTGEFPKSYKGKFIRF